MRTLIFILAMRFFDLYKLAHGLNARTELDNTMLWALIIVLIFAICLDAKELSEKRK